MARTDLMSDASTLSAGSLKHAQSVDYFMVEKATASLLFNEGVHDAPLAESPSSVRARFSDPRNALLFSRTRDCDSDFGTHDCLRL